nr:MAG TPA: hypothetical protein [Caudoviricetes sp.]
MGLKFTCATPNKYIVLQLVCALIQGPRTRVV